MSDQGFYSHHHNSSAVGLSSLSNESVVVVGVDGAVDGSNAMELDRQELDSRDEAASRRHELSLSQLYRRYHVGDPGLADTISTENNSYENGK